MGSSPLPGTPAFTGLDVGAAARGVRWIHGSRSPYRLTDPPIQTLSLTGDTFVLRQSKDLSYEAPFMYLFFGRERALLLDTGATSDSGKFPLRATVDRLVGPRLAGSGDSPFPLVVAHTHSHGDHVAGDPQFADRPCTRVVHHDLESIQRFFGASSRADLEGRCDLGGRILETIGTPGHHPTSLTVYDPWTRLLFTGDTVYPGRLYISDFEQYLASLERLIAFSELHGVRWLLGGHIEMTRHPGVDYPVTTRYQPDEAPLPMSLDQLRLLRAAAESVAQRPGAHTFNDFILFHGPCRAAVARQLLRGALRNFRHRLGE